MPIFESVPWGRKPNEKQGPKACQEDQRARKVQRKKCKGNGSAAEYKSVAKYSSLAEWLRQIKTNWTQDPFDPINIIWPTKAQILLYKRIGLKIDMKKHDKKKQGTTGSVSSRNHVKKRKEKPNQRKMINIAGNLWRNKTKHAAKWNRTNLLRQKWCGKQTQKGRSTTNLYPANTREVGPRSRGFRGCGLVVGGKWGLYLVSCRDFFWEYTLLGWYFTQKK